MLPLTKGELASGKVLTEEEAALVGTAPRLSDFHGVVFQYACDFKVNPPTAAVLSAKRENPGGKAGTVAPGTDG